MSKPENKKVTFQQKIERHVHAVEQENIEGSDSSDEGVTLNILTVAGGGSHSYYVSLARGTSGEYGD
jgi:hypothetical protein